MPKTLKASKPKDTLFKFIFGNEKHKQFALSLYNAVAHSHHTNLEDVKIVTLEDSVYINIKNDISLLLNDSLYMLEQQSTWNPNMTYRFLEYILETFKQSVLNIERLKYSHKMLEFPTPHFVVLYNGDKEKPAYLEERLSDHYKVKEEQKDLELVAHIYNINSGYSDSLKEQCRPLYEYVWLTEHLQSCIEKDSKRSEVAIGKALTKTLSEMPDSFEIKEIIMKDKKVVTPLIFQEFSQKEYEKVHREDVEIAREEGRVEGREEGRKEGKAIGASHKSNEIAISFLKDGFSPEIVAKNTGLPLAEVEALKASL